MGTREGRTTPPGDPDWIWTALGSPDEWEPPSSNHWWLFEAVLDLASLSEGGEPRAGAMKVFKGTLACLQLSELGIVPFESL